MARLVRDVVEVHFAIGSQCFLRSFERRDEAAVVGQELRLEFHLGQPVLYECLHRSDVQIAKVEPFVFADIKGFGSAVIPSGKAVPLEPTTIYGVDDAMSLTSRG